MEIAFNTSKKQTQLMNSIRIRVAKSIVSCKQLRFYVSHNKSKTHHEKQSDTVSQDYMNDDQHLKQKANKPNLDKNKDETRSDRKDFENWEKEKRFGSDFSKAAQDPAIVFPVKNE